jgi:hypothetical protein
VLVLMRDVNRIRGVTVPPLIVMWVVWQWNTWRDGISRVVMWVVWPWIRCISIYGSDRWNIKRGISIWGRDMWNLKRGMSIFGVSIHGISIHGNR